MPMRSASSRWLAPDALSREACAASRSNTQFQTLAPYS